MPDELPDELPGVAPAALPRWLDDARPGLRVTIEAWPHEPPA